MHCVVEDKTRGLACPLANCMKFISNGFFRLIWGLNYNVAMLTYGNCFMYFIFLDPFIAA